VRPNIFANPIYDIIFWTAFAIWMIPEFLGTLFQSSREGALRRDRGSSIVVFVCIYGALSLGFWFASAIPSAAIIWNQPALFALGITLLLVGVALRWYAIRILGESFTRQVAIRPDQKVVQAGPYRWIRHPSYSGSLLTLLGIGLALGNWASLAVIMGCTLSGYAYRVRVEERALCEVLGEQYIEYMQRTRRIIPFIF
jgi:protein-S-isoprenylcysteine O-methyltransferase Ste14